MNNRSKNPNEYGNVHGNGHNIHIVNTLGNRTRSRHSLIMNRFLNTILATNGLYELNTNGARTGSPSGNWPWGNFGIRLGGTRSADGMIFNLPDAPMNMTSNNKVVAKFIFSDDDDPANEIKISHLMGTHRIGPKIFKSYSANVSKTLFLRNVGTNRLHVRNGPFVGTSHINLFQQFQNSKFNNKHFNRVYIIIMENLYDNPSRGVLNGFTLYDILDHPRTVGVKIPVAQLRQKYDKMHELGVVHGDMHGRNILIQKLTRGRVGVRIIDFGRSIYRPGVHFTNATSTQAVINQQRINGTYRHRNAEMWTHLVQSVAGGALDAQKLKSGIVSVFNSLVRRNALSKQRAKVLREQLLGELSPIIGQYEGHLNVARQLKLNAAQRGSISKYNKSAQAGVIHNFVESLKRRKASGLRKLASVQVKKVATHQRRQALARPTVTGQKEFELNYGKRIKNLEKQLVQSLERRKVSRRARAHNYNAIMVERRRAASEQRRQGVAGRQNINSMNWLPSGPPVPEPAVERRRQNASAERRRQVASTERRRQVASTERRRQVASAERRRQVASAERRRQVARRRNLLPLRRLPQRRTERFDPFGVIGRIPVAAPPPSPPRPRQPYPPGHPRYLVFRN